MFTVSNIKKPGSSTSNLLFRKVPLLTVALVLVAATTHFNDDTTLAAGGTPSAGMKNMVGGFLQGVRETLNNIDDVKMFRAQVEVKTANVKYAGTNDDVQVKLNGQNQTWLDHSGNDFERGDVVVYDLNLDNLEQIKDITRLEVRKNGSNGLCIGHLRLIINNTEIFNTTYAKCHWLDNDSGHTRKLTISTSKLRTSKAWLSFGPLDPTFGGVPLASIADYMSELTYAGNGKFDVELTVPSEELVSRIESRIGHEIFADRSLYWGRIFGNAVEVSRKNDSVVHVDLDLAYSVNWWKDPAVDVDFDLRFTCTDGTVELHIRNVDVDVGVYHIIAGGIDIQFAPIKLVELPSCWDDLTVKKGGDIVIQINDVKIKF